MSDEEKKKNSSEKEEENEDGSKEEKEEKKKGSLLGENIEAFVVAVILALIIRHYSMEAFVIPTGSMAPTLLGIHMKVSCKNCGYDYNVGNPKFPPGEKKRQDEFVCPNCKDNFRTVISRGDLIGGHKILVNKFVYKFRKPRRWEVIVFRSPEPHHRNFIKRLVGLPGDKLQIFHGDIYLTKKGTEKQVLARKPDEVQKHLWMDEYNSTYREEEESRFVWDTPAKVGEPKVCQHCDKLIYIDPRFKIDYNQVKADFREGSGELRYHRKILDTYGYNTFATSRTGHPVGDIRMAFDVTISDPEGKLRLKLLRPLRRFELLLDMAEKKAYLEDYRQSSTSKERVAEGKMDVTKGQQFHLDVAHFDGQVILRINKKEIFRHLYKSPPRFEDYSFDLYQLLLTLEKSRFTLKNFRLWRDIHYTDSPSVYGVNQPVVLGPDEYFAMGDNSPNSEDSREWGKIPEENLLGKAFVVFWPAIPFYNWEAKWIR